MIWREVFNDLDKIKLTVHLNSPHALKFFLLKYPESCQASYIAFKEKPENSGKRMDVVINNWLKIEQKKEQAMDDFQEMSKEEFRATRLQPKSAHIVE